MMAIEEEVVAKEEALSISIASTVSEPVRSPSGPYIQMVYYAVAGFFFWAILMIQLPYIDKYFGGPEVVFYVIFAYGLSSNLIRVFLLWNASNTKKSQARQMRDLIILGSGLVAITMLAYPISMAILGTNPDNDTAGFWVGVTLSAFMGLWVSLLMNAGFNLMSLAPEKSASFFLLGQTATGIVTWPLLILLRFIVTQAGAEGDNIELYVAIISFGMACVVVAGCIPLYLFKTRYHPVFANVLVERPDTPSAPRPNTSKAHLRSVFFTIATPAMCAWLCSLITFSVFPAQISRWFPQNKGSYETSIYRSFLVYIFSIADTIGRSSPRFIPALLKMSNKVMWIFTCCRGLVFIPLFLMASNITAPLFSYDWFRLIIIIAFGISNGSNFSTANIVGPKRVQVADKIHAGTILSLAAINGVFVGTLLGIGLKYI
jgi:hypothetical protein